VSDVPPCWSDDITTLDSLDVGLTDPSLLSTIDSFTTTEPPGTYASNLSPDMRTLTILFDSAFPCLDGTTESISVVVTLDVPSGVPSGTQLTLDGDARGFATPPGDDYLAQRTATVLVQNPPPPPPPTPDPPDDDGGGPAGGGGAAPVPGRGATAVAATAVRATARFTG
jgi:hypothetical protein